MSRDHFGPRGLRLNKPVRSKRATRQCYILHFKHLSQMVLTKSFEYCSMYFYGLNLGPAGAGPSLTLEPSIEQTW